MPDDRSAADLDELFDLLEAAQRTVLTLPNAVTSDSGPIRAILTRVEAATPGGAPLHAQLDNVRKWLDALDQPAEHDRFGGTAHLRDYVTTQLRLALGALEDYRQSMS